MTCCRVGSKPIRGVLRGEIICNIFVNAMAGAGYKLLVRRSIISGTGCNNKLARAGRCIENNVHIFYSIPGGANGSDRREANIAGQRIRTSGFLIAGIFNAPHSIITGR